MLVEKNDQAYQATAPSWFWFLANALILVVLLIRISSVSQLTYDQSHQIEQSFNLVQGHGLSLRELDLKTLSVSYSLDMATWWGPLFPLILYPFFKLGMPLGIALKIIYSLASIIGWYGWVRFYRDNLHQHINVPLPLLFLFFLGLAIDVPEWNLSHIFQWMLFPYVLTYLYSYMTNRNWRSLTLSALFASLCYYFRHQGLVFVLVAIVLLAMQKKLGSRQKIKDCVAYGALFSIFALPMLFFILSMKKTVNPLAVHKVTFALDKAWEFVNGAFAKELAVNAQNLINYRIYDDYFQFLNVVGLSQGAFALYLATLGLFLFWHLSSLFDSSLDDSDRMMRDLISINLVCYTFLAIVAIRFMAFWPFYLIYQTPTRYLFLFVILCFASRWFFRKQGPLARGMLSSIRHVLGAVVKGLSVILIFRYFYVILSWPRPMPIDFTFKNLAKVQPDLMDQFPVAEIIANNPQAIFLYNSDVSMRRDAGLNVFFYNPEALRQMGSTRDKELFILAPKPETLTILKESGSEVTMVAEKVYIIRKS